jgi:hypothetical protein
MPSECAQARRNALPLINPSGIADPAVFPCARSVPWTAVRLPPPCPLQRQHPTVTRLASNHSVHPCRLSQRALQPSPSDCGLPRRRRGEESPRFPTQPHLSQPGAQRRTERSPLVALTSVCVPPPHKPFPECGRSPQRPAAPPLSRSRPRRRLANRPHSLLAPL